MGNSSTRAATTPGPPSLPTLPWGWSAKTPGSRGRGHHPLREAPCSPGRPLEPGPGSDLRDSGILLLFLLGGTKGQNVKQGRSVLFDKASVCPGIKDPSPLTPSFLGGLSRLLSASHWTRRALPAAHGAGGQVPDSSPPSVSFVACSSPQPLADSLLCEAL